MEKNSLLLPRQLGLVCVSLFLLLGSGCQTAAKETPRSIAQMRLTLTSTVYPTAAGLPPTGGTAIPSTPTRQPTATAQPTLPTAPLSLEALWLAYPSGNGISIVNQDGSGRTQFDEPGRSGDFPFFLICHSGPLVVDESPFNRMVNIDGGIHVVRPPNLMSVYRPSHRRGGCSEMDLAAQADGTYLLANILGSDTPAQAELMIYELPSGKMRDRLALVKCAAQAPPDCDQYSHNWQVEWSPNNRYLAFPRVLDGTSTDLYIYDSKDGSTRRLTSGPENVDHFWWSPNGTWIILSEMPGLFSEEDYKSALWAVSLETGEIRFLYTLSSPILSIPDWLTNESFLTVDGYIAIADEVASNLRLVNISGATKMLFDDRFYTADLGGQNQYVAIWDFEGGRYEQGTYLIPLANPTPQFVAVDSFYPNWNDDLGLFVGDYDSSGVCKDQPNKVPAFDLHGKIQCIEEPTPAPDPFEANAPDPNLSPNQRWQVLLKTDAGVSVEDVNNKSRLVVTKDMGTQVIWCPNSTCFFLISKQILYHVTFPGLVIEVVDANLGRDTLEARWMERP